MDALGSMTIRDLVELADVEGVSPSDVVRRLRWPEHRDPALVLHDLKQLEDRRDVRPSRSVRL